MTGLPNSLRLPRKPPGTARQGLGATGRIDDWGIEPAIVALGFTTFIVYSLFSALVWGPLFHVGYEADGYLSPFFSPLIRPDWLPTWFSPAIAVLWIPLGLRATCYYYRKAYYRSYFADPPACAVGEPTIHRRYRMETVFPFVLQNLHRFFLYLAFVPLFFLWLDALLSFRDAGGWRIGLGGVILTVNVILLSGFSLSCHSFRHLVGGKLDCFSCSRRAQMRHGLWRRATWMNGFHMRWAWASLISVGLADLYVRLLAMGILADPVIHFSARRTQRMADPAKLQRRAHDVLVIGAGGAGLRAAIEAKASGADVGLVCKSLLGKAHTVMAEGGVAAALGHVAPADSWQIHFRDTMVGGKLLNNPRMAQLHAIEAPVRVRELETWGAVFDRTPDGRILQRPFGGHSHPRLAHVGDRTGLEMIRTLQDRAVAAGIQVYMECTITRLITGPAGVTGAFGYWRTTGQPIAFAAKATVLATGGIGKAYEVTSNSWEYSGDGQALAYEAGAELIDMEFVQFHPTGMVWPPGVRGLLVTEAVRGEGGILRNASGERFMWKYLPDERRAEYAATDEEATRWVTALSQGRQTDARRPPELSTRDNVARAIYTEVKEGRGSPHGGVFLDISYLPADHVRRKLPSMYEQFKELADVDITRGPMEVGPTTHYVMGGIRVDAETGATTVPGLYAAGEVAAGLHGANRLGGNSLSDLLVFGARTGASAAIRATGQAVEPYLDPVQIQAAAGDLAAPLERRDGEDPYAIQRDLQAMMQSLVGIFRVEADLDEALRALDDLRRRWKLVRATGGRAYNPGWNLVFELGNLLTVSEAIARSARQRTESRGAHSRLDHPATNDGTWSRLNSVVARADDGTMAITASALPTMTDELRGLLGADQ